MEMYINMKRAYLATSYTWKSPLRKIPLIGKMLGRIVEYVRYIRVSKCTAALLNRTGWNIFSPITHSHIIPRWIPNRLNTHTFWLGMDFDWISACDEVWVFMQPGWNESYGVSKEIELAITKLNKKIRYVKMDYMFKGDEPKYYEHPKDVHTDAPLG
jgi:hypothetical protein